MHISFISLFRFYDSIHVKISLQLFSLKTALTFIKACKRFVRDS